MTMTKEEIRELRRMVAEELPEPVIILGNLEHQIDLISELVRDLSGVVKAIDPDLISEGVQKKLDVLDKLLAVSSINTENLDHPLTKELLDGAIGLKGYTRIQQRRYLKAQGIEV